MSLFRISMYRIILLTLIVCFLKPSINGDDDDYAASIDDTSNLNFDYVDVNNNNIDDEMDDDVILLYYNNSTPKKGKENRDNYPNNVIIDDDDILVLSSCDDISRKEDKLQIQIDVCELLPG